MFKDKKSGIWNYRHELPSGKWFVRSSLTRDRTKAEQAWTALDAEYNALAAGQRSRKRYEDSKDARREKFWQAAARFIIWTKATNGGRLPRPAHVEVPTAMRVTSHPFIYVRSAFLQWAKEQGYALELATTGTLDATATNMMLPPTIPALRWLSAGQRRLAR